MSAMQEIEVEDVKTASAPASTVDPISTNPNPDPGAVILTYKYKLKGRSARRVLDAHAIAVNQAWNWCVNQHRHRFNAYQPGYRQVHSQFDLQKQMKGAGKVLGLNQQTIGEICRFFVQSRLKLPKQQWRRGPRFRVSFGARRSLGWVPFLEQSRQVAGNSITYMGKTYRFFGHKRRPLPSSPAQGRVKGGCFVQDASGAWHVCFTVVIPRAAMPARRREAGQGRLGIDLGLKSLLTTSNGQSVAPGHHYRKMEDKLAAAQRTGQQAQMRRLHRKIRRCRQDDLHKLSARLARDNAFIAIGDVNAARLAQTPMAKSMLDAGWSTLRHQLAYKARMHRAEVVEVNESHTTRRCSACHSLTGPTGKEGLAVRAWTCETCGTAHDRDINAARNILFLALSAQGHVKPGTHLDG